MANLLSGEGFDEIGANVNVDETLASTVTLIGIRVLKGIQ